MRIVNEKKISYPALAPFDFYIKYTETPAGHPARLTSSHVHPECEIYINISGDVSFMVEQRIYPVLPGNIVISRPYEYHHCIYHSATPHKHFWILFTPNGNEELCRPFFDRECGEDNLLSLPPQKQKRLLEVCHQLAESDASGAIGFSRFFELLSLINDAVAIVPNTQTYTDTFRRAITYIDDHFTENITITNIADEVHVSVNTLERHFLSALDINPMAYIKKKRLAHAASLLSDGASVLEASISSGFSDYSGFISLFKQSYGMTPLKYKKSLSDASKIKRENTAE